MPMLKGRNVVSEYGDSETVSDEFADKLVNKYLKADEEEISLASPGEVKAYLFEKLEVDNETEDEAIRDTMNAFGITEKVALGYLSELDRSIGVEAKRVASKEALVDLGFTSVGTGIYKDAEHHIWNLKREGNEYVIERDADEEDILKDRKLARTASKKVSREITIEGSSPEDVSRSLSGIQGEFASLVYNKDAEGAATTGSIDEDEYVDFKSAAESSGLRVAKVSEIERSKKVFSDEAVKTGIFHYTTMGFNEKEAINNFIKSHDLDKKEYEPVIKEILAKYN